MRRCSRSFPNFRLTRSCRSGSTCEKPPTRSKKRLRGSSLSPASAITALGSRQNPGEKARRRACAEQRRKRRMTPSRLFHTFLCHCEPDERGRGNPALATSLPPRIHRRTPDRFPSVLEQDDQQAKNGEQRAEQTRFTTLERLQPESFKADEREPGEEGHSGQRRHRQNRA